MFVDVGDAGAGGDPDPDGTVSHVLGGDTLILGVGRRSLDRLDPAATDAHDGAVLMRLVNCAFSATTSSFSWPASPFSAAISSFNCPASCLNAATSSLKDPA